MILDGIKRGSDIAMRTPARPDIHDLVGYGCYAAVGLWSAFCGYLILHP